MFTLIALGFTKVVEVFRRAHVHRTKRRNAKLYERGYFYALHALETGLASAEYLYRQTETAEVLGSFTDYHQGMRAGIYDAEESAVA